MRIITGAARGRKLRSLPGEATRPTSDRVKESMFNILQFHLEGRRVLDLFAGSGQLGLEALSRGATHCTFADINPQCTALIQQNAETCGFSPQCEIRTADAVGSLRSFGEKFDVIFLDPPYNAGLLPIALDQIADLDLVNPGGLILAERRANEPQDPVHVMRLPYRLCKTYRYSGVLLCLYERAIGGHVF